MSIGFRFTRVERTRLHREACHRHRRARRAAARRKRAACIDLHRARRAGAAQDSACIDDGGRGRRSRSVHHERAFVDDDVVRISRRAGQRPHRAAGLFERREASIGAGIVQRRDIEAAVRRAAERQPVARAVAYGVAVEDIAALQCQRISTTSEADCIGSYGSAGLGRRKDSRSPRRRHRRRRRCHRRWEKYRRHQLYHQRRHPPQHHFDC